MSKLNKLLSLIFVVFAFIITVELFLYFTNLNKPEVQLTSKNEVSQNNLPKIDPQVTAEKIFLTKYRNKLIKEGIITDSVNITTYQGTISDIKWREESIPSINFKYVLKIKLKGKNDTFDFVFSEDELKMTQTTKIENTDEKKADIKDLRPGDDITIIWTTNANKSGIFRETKNIKIIIN